MKTIAEELREFRHQRAIRLVNTLTDVLGVSRYKIAKKIGVKWPTIWRWFEKETVPRESQLLALERFYRSEVNRNAKRRKKSKRTYPET
jgi:predicted DNA-binding transcriptional regulator AlpA